MEPGRIFVGAIVTLIAGGLWSLSFYLMKLGLPSLTWPKAKGRILSSAVDSTGDFAEAKVTYEYYVEGLRCGGKRLTPFDKKVSFSGSANRLVSAFPEGAEVLVSHHPARPEQSVLRPGPGFLGWGVTAAAMGLTALALLTLFASEVRPQKLLASVTSFVSLGALAFALRLLTAGSSTRNFAQTSGVILTSRVVGSEGRMFQEAGKPQPTHYAPSIRYRYEVNGQSFVSDQVQMGAGFATTIPSIAENSVHRYPAGRPVTVFYEPSNPQHSVLEHGTSLGGVFFALAFAGMFGMASLILFFVA